MNSSYNETDLFLTHTWREDEQQRNNHKRVARINDLLCRKGYRTWFDGQRMEGPVRQKMADGIDSTQCVIAFVSNQYMLKVNSKDPKDNCSFEYMRAMEKKTNKYIVCVAMEPAVKLPSEWKGYLEETMGDCICVWMTDSFENNEAYLTTQVDELVAQLELKGVFPSQVRKHCSKCNVIGEGKYLYPYPGDGNFCTTCGDGLQEIRKPKNYCGTCNIHELGIFCGNCGQGLQARGEREQVGISDMVEEFYAKMLNEETCKPKEVASNLSSEEETDFERIKRCEEETKNIRREKTKLKESVVQFTVRAEQYQDRMEATEEDMENLDEERCRLTDDGEKLSLTEERYRERKKACEDMATTLDNEIIQLRQAASNFTIMDATFLQNMKESEEKLKELRERRSHLKERASSVSLSDESYHEKMISVQDELQLFKEERLNRKVAEETYSVEKDAYREKLEECERNLKKLLAERSEVKEFASTFALNEVTYKDGLKKREDEVTQLKEIGVVTGENLASNHDHPRSCGCDMCKVEQDLKLLEGAGFAYIGGLVLNNDVTTLSNLIDVRNDVISMRGGDRNFTPFLQCASQGTGAMLQMLESKGASLSDVDVHNRTPLNCALHDNNMDTLEWLCQHHNELLHVGDNDADTPLHTAAYWGFSHLLTTLLQHGADVTKRNNYGHTPLARARGRGQTSCANVLVKWMKDHGIPVK